MSGLIMKFAKQELPSNFSKNARLQDLTPPFENAPHEKLITFVQDRAGHDCDATKMKDKLHWQPAETFETGIWETIVSYLTPSNLK